MVRLVTRSEPTRRYHALRVAITDAKHEHRRLRRAARIWQGFATSDASDPVICAQARIARHAARGAAQRVRRLLAAQRHVWRGIVLKSVATDQSRSRETRRPPSASTSARRPAT